MGPDETARRFADFGRMVPRRRFVASEDSYIAGEARSAAEDGSGSDARGLRPLGGGDLLAFLRLHFRDLDLAALRGDADRFRTHLGHLADLALHRAERAHEVLLRAEELQLLAAVRGPCAGRRIAAADDVVHEIHVV